MSEAERITELLAEALRQQDEGGEEALERFLDEHEAEADRLRAHLRDLRGLGMLEGPSEDDSIPERLGEYVLLERLGIGGMGVVFRAEQPSLRREVALKLIRPEHLFFPESRQRFQREVEAVARLEHPRIVRVYEAAREDRLPYFTMELVRGVPLSRVLARLRSLERARLDDRALRDVLAEWHDDEDPPLFQPRGRSWVEVCLGWAKDLAEALSYAHGAGVLHRDVKPSNIMLTWDGRVMLLDFGLASTQGGTRITRSGAMLGSLAYMAPEQMRGDVDAISPRTDVYSLGVVLYELLSLRHPFQDEDSNAEQVGRRILEGVVRRPSDHGHALPWDTETVCMAALERDPERRYADAAALARDLDNVLCFRPIEARRPGPLLRLRRLTQRRPAASVGGLLGLVLVLGGPLGLWRAQVAQTRAVRAEQQRTQEALLEVQHQRDEVTRQKELAERRLDLAIEVVSDVSTQIAYVELRDVPEAGPVRNQLFDITGRSAARLLEEVPDHREAREMASRIDLNRGVMFLEQDRYDLARPLLTDAAAALRALWEEDPHDLTLPLQVGICLGNLGVIGQDRADLDEAEDYFRESWAVLEQALELAEPGEVRHDLLYHTASTLLNLGTLQTSRDDAQAREDGVALLLEARSRAEKALEDDQRLMTRNLQVVILNNLAACIGDKEAALDVYREAVACSRAIEESAPSQRNARYYLAVALGNLGHQLQVIGTPEALAESDGLVDEAVQRLRRLCLDYPERDDFRLELAKTMLSRGMLDEELKRSVPAELAVLSESLGALEPLCEKGFPSAHLSRGVGRLCLAGVYQRQDRTEEMAETARLAYRDLRAAGLRFPDWRPRYEKVMSELRTEFGEALDVAGEPD